VTSKQIHNSQYSPDMSTGGRGSCAVSRHEERAGAGDVSPQQEGTHVFIYLFLFVSVSLAFSHKRSGSLVLSPHSSPLVGLLNFHAGEKVVSPAGHQ